MEPAPKRRRTGKPDEVVYTSIRPQHSHPPAAQPVSNNQQVMLPTRTIDLSDFRRRAFHAYRSGDGGAGLARRGGRMYLLPRAPVATVTAKVIDVAIFDGAGATPITQIAEPSSDVVVNIGTIGTLTIPGINPITSTTEPTTAQTSDTTSSAISGTGSTTHWTNSASVNGTSVASGDNTVTITATSTLTVSYLNGTLVIPPRTTMSKSATTAARKIAGGASSDGDEPPTDTVTEANGVAQTSMPGNQRGAISTSTSSLGPTPSSEPGGSGITLSPQQQQVVGGVVGGVAGVALVLVALLYFLKWYRQRLRRLGTVSDHLSSPRHAIENDDVSRAGAQPQTTEISRTSIGPLAAVASRLKQFRPHSTNTVSTVSTRESLPAGTGERSFQRIAGRRIPSVLSAGGDGYGGHYGVFDHPSHRHHDSETSIYQDDFVNGASVARHPSSISRPSTPTRVNPFNDPPSVSRDSYRSPRPFSPSTNFSRPTASREVGVPDHAPHSPRNHRPPFSPVTTPTDGYATWRPSPARTAIAQSPIRTTVHLPQPSSTPPLMAGEVPDLPAVPILTLPPRGKRDRVASGLGGDSGTAQRSTTRSLGGASGRTSSTGGRFREDI